MDYKSLDNKAVSSLLTLDFRSRKKWGTDVFGIRNVPSSVTLVTYLELLSLPPLFHEAEACL